MIADFSRAIYRSPIGTEGRVEELAGETKRNRPEAPRRRRYIEQTDNAEGRTPSAASSRDCGVLAKQSAGLFTTTANARTPGRIIVLKRTMGGEIYERHCPPFPDSTRIPLVRNDRNPSRSIPIFIGRPPHCLPGKTLFRSRAELQGPGESVWRTSDFAVRFAGVATEASARDGKIESRTRSISRRKAGESKRGEGKRSRRIGRSTSSLGSERRIKRSLSSRING